MTEPLEVYDVLIIGAGPTGLACGIDAKHAGLKYLLVDKGCLVNSLYNYPPNMGFFTSRDLLEIGNIPFPSVHVKPTREEGLEYYRSVTQRFQLPIRFYERVVKVEGRDGAFRITTQKAEGEEHGYHSRKLVVATGYYDLPNLVGIPGEDLGKVSHYYSGPYEFYRQRVAVIGGSNSAAETALDLYRHGAEVVLVHRKAELSRSIKYWIKPDIENRIREGSIKALFESRVVEIARDSIRVENSQGESRTIENDFVFALTGYHPDVDLLRQFGVDVDSKTLRPRSDPDTLESNVEGIYLAGVIIAGAKTNEIFIENGRFHGKQIIADIERKFAEPKS